MTRDPNKVEILYEQLPKEIKIIGKCITKSYFVNWQRQGSHQFQGSRYTFEIDYQQAKSP